MCIYGYVCVCVCTHRRETLPPCLRLLVMYNHIYTYTYIYTCTYIYIYTHTHTHIYITVQSSYDYFPVYVCSLQRCPGLPCPGSSPRIVKLVLRAGAQLGLEPRPSEANAWLFCTAGEIPKPVLGKCQKYPWGLVKYGLFADSTPGLRRPRSRPRLGIFNQSPLVTLMETHRVHSAPGWTPSCPVPPPMEPSSLSSEDVSLLLPQEKPSAFCSCTTGLSERCRAQGQPQIWICSLI